MRCPSSSTSVFSLLLEPCFHRHSSSRLFTGAFNSLTKYKRPLFVGAEAQQPRKEHSANPANDTSGDALSRPARGFGTAAPSSKSSKESEEKKPSKTETTTASRTRRRPAPEKPVAVSQADPEAQKMENIFIVTWAGLAIVIFTEGLTLAASGLLPEEWDSLLFKYVYPAFTPTVGIFLAGAVVFGLYKTSQSGGKADSE